MARRITTKCSSLICRSSASVPNAHSDGFSLNQMQFCAGHQNCGSLAGGRTASEHSVAGVADHQYRTRDTCGLRGISAATRLAGTVARPPPRTTAIDPGCRRGQPVVYDLDLTGQPVSSTSATYPGAAFGSRRVDNQARLGCQLARGSLLTHTGERIWLAGFHHPGKTVCAFATLESDYDPSGLDGEQAAQPARIHPKDLRGPHGLTAAPDSTHHR